MEWKRTVALEQLQPERPVVKKHGRRQVAVLRRGDRILAFDNRCPHEGYPLSQGRVDARCVLTCDWHNWKFDLADGRNLLGTDDLRVYPTRVRDGWVEVGVAERNVAAAREEGLASLKAAFDDRDYDRLARAISRLHFAGIQPTLALEQAIGWSHDRLEYGMTHAWAATADWLTLYDESSGLERRIAALTEAVDHMADDSLRQPRFPFPDAATPFEATSFRAAVEAEDEAAALARIEGGLNAGLRFSDFEAGLCEAALDHYLDFGHALIYVQKVGELIRRLGREVERPLLRGLVRSLVYATREDLVPAFRSYAAHLAACSDGAGAGSDATRPGFPHGAGVERALAWAVAERTRHSAPEVLTALVEAAGRHLLLYDTRLDDRSDLPVSRNFGWLGVTHAVTFAAALAELAGRHPQLWRPGLLQLACLLGRAAPFVERECPPELERLDDTAAFEREAIDRVFDHGLREPIFACHLLKTALAARRLAGAVDAPARGLLLAGTRRFLRAPVKQRFVLRSAAQAVYLVGLDYEAGGAV